MFNDLNYDVYKHRTHYRYVEWELMLSCRYCNSWSQYADGDNK